MVDHAADGVEGRCRGPDHDVAIVDRMLPRLDRLNLVQRCAEGNQVPVLFQVRSARSTTA